MNSKGHHDNSRFLHSENRNRSTEVLPPTVAQVAQSLGKLVGEFQYKALLNGMKRPSPGIQERDGNANLSPSC